MSVRVDFAVEPSTFARLTVAISRVDREVEATARTIGAAARASYKASVPSRRVAAAVTSRYRKSGATRTVRTGIANKPLGPPVHGRDPFAQALGYWLDSGTGFGTGKPNRLGDGKIRRATLEPFVLGGKRIPFVSGQRAQHWLGPALSSADSVSDGLVTRLGDRIDDVLAAA